MSRRGMFLASLQDELQAACAVRLHVLCSDPLGGTVDDDIALPEKVIECSSNLQTHIAYRFGLSAVAPNNLNPFRVTMRARQSVRRAFL
jgi:hypothetical protein